MEFIRWFALGLAVVGILLYLSVEQFFVDNRPIRLMSWGILIAIVMILLGVAGLQAL